MTLPTNRSALLTSPSLPLQVTPVPVPTPDLDSVVIQNHAVALNPLDATQASKGVMIKSFPACIGSDVAGTIHSVGARVTRFRPGDRVVGHAWSLMTGRPQDGAFGLYTNVPEGNVAGIPEGVAFRDAAVLPMAVDTAVCGLFAEGGMGLEMPVVGVGRKKKEEAVVVYGASSSVGSMAVQLANAAGYRVVGIAGARNRELVEAVGAEVVVDYADQAVVEHVLEAVDGHEVLGVYDAIGTADSHKIVVPILEKLGKGVLCSTKAIPDGLPAEIKVKRMFGIGDFSFPVWKGFVGQGLESGQLKCLPKPFTVGKGLESIDEGLKKVAAGVSGQKLVVELL